MSGLVGLALLFTAPSAPAQVNFTLTPSVQYGVVSNAVVFTGTLQNTNSVDVFLNSAQVSFTGIATNYLAANTNEFFANVPGVLYPGETYADVIFGVLIATNTPPGNYFGSITVKSGTNMLDVANGANQPFQVTVAGSPFAAWQQAQFGVDAGNAAVSGLTADPEGDGIVNLLEYALHLDPNISDASGLPPPEPDADCNCLTLTYTKSLAATDVSYTPEEASGPGGAYLTTGITESIIDADTVTLTIRARDAAHPFSTDDKRFLHLKVTKSP